MTKGDVSLLPSDLFRTGADVYVGLGWGSDGGGVDLDASVLIGDEIDGGRLLGCVSFAHKEYAGGAIVHGGDAKGTGDGKGGGDDERIQIDLDRLPATCASLWIVVTLMTDLCASCCCGLGGGADLTAVRNAYVRLVALNGNLELARFTLHSGLGGTGVVFAKLCRAPRVEMEPMPAAEPGASSSRAAATRTPWLLVAMGEECGGKPTLADSAPVRKVCGITSSLREPFS